MHIGDTAVPVKVIADDTVWQIAPRTTNPDRTVLGIDGDLIVVDTVAEDGTYTVTTLAPTPPRRRREPDGCPCTAIYTYCRCPVRP